MRRLYDDFPLLTRSLLLLNLVGVGLASPQHVAHAQADMIGREIVEAYTGKQNFRQYSEARIEVIIYYTGADYKHEFTLQVGSGDSDVTATGYAFSAIVSDDGTVVSKMDNHFSAEDYFGGSRRNIQSSTSEEDISKEQFSHASFMISRVILCGIKRNITGTITNNCDPSLREIKAFFDSLPRSFTSVNLDALKASGWGVVDLHGKAKAL